MNVAKIGVIDVGGGLRGIYAAGVFDWCLENGVKFDYGIGISAGSANLASYLSGQRGRNYLFYEEYSMRRQYMGAGNMLRSGSFLNLQYIYGTLSNAGCENPLDLKNVCQSDGVVYDRHRCDNWQAKILYTQRYASG